MKIHLEKISSYRKRIVMCGIALLLFFPCITVFAADLEERETVRVGFFGFDGYHTIDENGIRSGYGYEFLCMISRYWNVSFEYIGYENSWEDMAEMLRNGEIDVVTSARDTPERKKEFAFSKPIGTSSAMLTTKSDNYAIQSGIYSTYDGMTIGLLKGNSRNDDLKEFAQENGFTYEPVYFEMYTDLEAALQEGQIDAALTSSLRETDNEHVLDYFSVEQFYAMVRKEDTQLLEQLDYAIDQLDAVEGDWKNELNNKYYFHQEERNLTFTQEEQALIRQYKNGEKELLVSACTDKEPYAYTEKGKTRGILFDYFKELADYVGIPYTTVAPTDREEYLEWCEEETEPNVFLDGRFANIQQMEEKGKSVTEVYTTMYLAKVTRRDFDGKIDTLAVATSQGLFGIEDGLAPHAERLEVSTRSEAMQAVLDGKADATFVYLYTAQQFVNQDERGLLTYTMLEKPTYDYHISFASTENKMLAGIFTKAIYAMPAETFENIASEYTSYKAGEIDLITWMKIHPITALGLGTLLLFILFLSILLLQRERAVRIEQKRSAQLQELAVLADSASHAKTTFLNNMSHDIRTPMNAIVGITTLMGNETGLSDKMQKYVQKVQVSSQYLLSLINDVLDMSKIEANEVSLNEESFILSEQIAQVERIIREEAEKKDQIFWIQIEKLIHNYVVGDSVRLRQILINLLSNSVKYTKKEGRIDFKVEDILCEQEGYAKFRFTISDNGMGMSQEFLEHIFDPFARAENSVTNKIQGTGLGMPITKNLVNLMNGDIEIESALGEGTTTVVTICLKKDKKADYLPEIKRMLLLTEDDTLQYNMENIFEKQKAEVYSASAVEDAEELLKEQFFDVIILGEYAVRPDLSEIISRLRKISSNKTMILCLDYVNTGNEQEFVMRCGADGFLTRPFSLEDMNRMIQQTKNEEQEEEKEESILKGMNFLCAEDNALNAEILAALLEMNGASCTIYADGAQLVEAFADVREGEYDAILMDIQMPNMNGLEAAEAIRRGINPLGRTIPILAMTANAFAEDMQATKDAGMDVHLSKPIDLELLEKAVQNVVCSKEI